MLGTGLEGVSDAIARVETGAARRALQLAMYLAYYAAAAMTAFAFAAFGFYQYRSSKKIQISDSFGPALG